MAKTENAPEQNTEIENFKPRSSLLKSVQEVQAARNRDEMASDGGSSGRSDGNDKT